MPSCLSPSVDNWAWSDVDLNGGDQSIVTNAMLDPTDPAAQKHWQPFGFQGLYYDIETGLYYARGRYYNPRTGTWLSADYNGTGVHMVPALSYHGQNITTSTTLALTSQYTDGLGLYTAFQNNPLRHSNKTS